MVTIAQAMRGELIAAGVAATASWSLPNGVDTERFRPMGAVPSRWPARLGLNGGPVIGFVGSFYHYEGLRFLLERGAGAARARVPGVRLLLVGAARRTARFRVRRVPRWATR